MSKRSKSKREKRDWRWWASFALNAFVAASMVLGTIFVFAGAPQPAPAVPTIVPPTESAGSTTPTGAPTTAPAAPATPTATPGPSPKPGSHNLSGPSGRLAQNNVAVGIPTATLFSTINVTTGSS